MFEMCGIVLFIFVYRFSKKPPAGSVYKYQSVFMDGGHAEESESLFLFSISESRSDAVYANSWPQM